MSAIFVYGLFLFACLAGLFRPWVGVVMFYLFAILDPGWNWRWAIDRRFPFQEYLAICLVLGFLLSGLRVPGLRRANLLPVLSGAAFLGLAFLSGEWSIDPEPTAYYLSNLWKVFFVALIAVAVVDTPQKALVMLAVATLAQGYNALQINLQYFQDGASRYATGGWAGGTKGDNNVYTIYTIPMLACSMSLMVCVQQNWARLLFAGVAILQIHQTMLLESRGGMLGVVLLGGILVWGMPKTRINVVGLCVFLGLAAVLAGPPVVREFSTIFQDQENRDSSAESRFYVWKAGLEITLDNPLLGVGPWAGARKVPSYYEGGEIAGDRKQLHNLFFEISTGMGVPATVLYFAMFVIPWWWCFRLLTLENSERQPQWHTACVALAVTCGLPGYFLASMFSSGALLETSYILVVAACSITATSATFEEVDEDDESIQVT